MQLRTIAWCLALALTPVTVSGCFLVAAGAGAAGAIAFTNRGAQSDVAGSVDEVFARATTAFEGAGIRETGRSTEESGTKRRLVGSKGELEVTVELERSTSTTTRVEVIARKSAVEYDKDLAKDVLGRILAQ
jgi:hypothetical protein